MLTTRQHILISIAVKYTLHKRGAARKEIKRAKRLGIPRRVLEELFVHLSLVLGYPAMLDGLEKLQQEWPRKRRRAETSKPWKDGRTILKRIYGAQTEKLLDNLRRLHPEAAHWILHDVYAKIFSRRGLSLRDRELVTVAVLSLQKLEPQLYSHVRGAMRLGMRTSSMLSAFALIRTISGFRQDTARDILRLVVSQKKMS